MEKYIDASARGQMEASNKEIIFFNSSLYGMHIYI